MLSRAGQIAGHRFPFSELEAEIRTSSARHGIDPLVLAAVLAIENHARGRVWRGVEICAARLLLALGRRRRVERLSLGIAQIQPCRVPGDQPLRERVDRLLARPDSVDLCAQIVAEIHGNQDLPSEAAKWSGGDWEVIGFGYGGDRLYGRALSRAYEVLKLRAGDRAPSVR